MALRRVGPGSHASGPTVRPKRDERPVPAYDATATIGSVVTIEHSLAPPVTARPLRDERDWWAIRALLVETHPRVAAGWNWDIRRWDGWRYHRARPLDDRALADAVGLWETPDGRLVGAVHPEAIGEAFLELDPTFRYLEPEMVRWAEDHLAGPPDDLGRSGPALWVLDDDEIRLGLLQDLGYERQAGGAWLRRLSFGAAGPGPSSAPRPYRVRTTVATDADCARMAELLNASFGRTVHTAREYRTFVERSPSFVPDLNLVAVAADGSFAAHVGVTYDAVNRHGIVEPVCTHPDHRRAGLARTLLLEGLRRLYARDALTAHVDTGEDVAANALYASCGFTEASHLHRWRSAF
jgi:ribosomal protein S18 acetylase RimI-like enzyme